VTLSTELSLVLLAIGLYMVDCLRLLHWNEGVLRVSGGRWRASLGAERFQILRRHPYLVPLLLPASPVFRMNWLAAPVSNAASNAASDFASAAAAARLRELAAALRPLAPYAWLQLLVMFVVVPLCLFRFPGMPLLLAVGYLYVNAIVHLAMSALKRKKLALPWQAVAVVAAECLVCIPFSINLVRKLAARTGDAGNLVPLARELLSTVAYAEFAGALSLRIEGLLETADEGSEHHLMLSRVRGELVAPA
jgi:hypothetical protein